jgi:hypothetical protein
MIAEHPDERSARDASQNVGNQPQRMVEPGKAADEVMKGIEEKGEDFRGDDEAGSWVVKSGRAVITKVL